MLSTHQFKTVEKHHRVSKTEPASMEEREQDWVVAAPQPEKGLLTTLP